MRVSWLKALIIRALAPGPGHADETHQRPQVPVVVAAGHVPAGQGTVQIEGLAAAEGGQGGAELVEVGIAGPGADGHNEIEPTLGVGADAIAPVGTAALGPEVPVDFAVAEQQRPGLHRPERFLARGPALARNDAGPAPAVDEENAVGLDMEIAPAPLAVQRPQLPAVLNPEAGGPVLLVEDAGIHQHFDVPVRFQRPAQLAKRAVGLAPAVLPVQAHRGRRRADHAIAHAVLFKDEIFRPGASDQAEK